MHACCMCRVSAGFTGGDATAVCVQGFRTAEEVDRFGQLMDELCYIVATKHSGSLKVRLSSSVACWPCQGAPKGIAWCSVQNRMWLHSCTMVHLHAYSSRGGPGAD